MAVELNLDSTFLQARGISVKHITADDKTDYNLRVHFEEAFEFIEDALSKNGRILVHCAVGVGCFFMSKY
jgi:protein-tyrosine phosphatase